MCEIDPVGVFYSKKYNTYLNMIVTKKYDIGSPKEIYENVMLNVCIYIFKIFVKGGIPEHWSRHDSSCNLGRNIFGRQLIQPWSCWWRYDLVSCTNIFDGD